MQVMSGSKGQEIVYTWARLNTPTHKELSDTIDAALRRAKADGVREASGAAKKLANGVVPTAAMNALNLLGVELDARAAQIEEGE
jgi:hypothetical protein